MTGPSGPSPRWARTAALLVGFLVLLLFLRLFGGQVRYALGTLWRAPLGYLPGAGPLASPLREGFPGTGAWALGYLAVALGAGMAAARKAAGHGAPGRAGATLHQAILGLAVTFLVALIPAHLAGLLGLAGLPRPLSFPALLLEQAPFALAAFLLPQAWFTPAPEVTGADPEGPTAPPDPGEEAAELRAPLWACAALLAGTLALVWGEGLALGPACFDGLWYHLPSAVQWFQGGLPAPWAQAVSAGMTWTEVACWLSADAHMALFLGLALPKGGCLVALAQVPALALALASLVGLGRLAGFPERVSWVPALVFLSAPMTLYQARQPMVDSLAAGFALGALYFLVRAFRLERPDAGLALGGLLTGLALTSKFYSGMVPTLAAAWLGLRLLRNRQPGAAVLLASCVAAPGAWWVLRNLEFLGSASPLRVLGESLYQPWFQDQGAWLASHLTGRCLSENFGFGPAWLAFCLAGAALTLPRLRRRWPEGLAPVALGWGLLLVFWWNSYTREYRHVYLAYALVTLLAGLPFLEVRGRARQAVGWLLAACVALSCGLTLDYMLRVDRDPAVRPWYRPSRALAEALDGLPPGTVAMHNSGYPEDVRVMRFFLSGRHFQHRVVDRPGVVQAPPQALASPAFQGALRRAGFDYLYDWCPGDPPPLPGEVFRSTSRGLTERLVRLPGPTAGQDP